LCYITGENDIISNNHPKIIRHRADQAKLISVPTDQGFITYQGRFIKPEQACEVSYEVSQKAHSALRWLINRQGYHDNTRAIVAWATSGKSIPKIISNTLSLFRDVDEFDVKTIHDYTAQELGIRLSKLIAVYTVKLGNTEEIVVIGLNSSQDNKGRIAITFYRELSGSDFLNNIKSWHDPETGCTWWQNYNSNQQFFGAPSPKDIAEAAFNIEISGREISESEKKLRGSTIERLLPCITDGTNIPRDLIEACIRQASHRLGNRYGNTEAKTQYWNWEKTLGIACALYRYYYKNERRYSVTLERDRKNRDYLYGRLLAVAEGLERAALKAAGEQRETNAGRLMQRFADRPYSTWLVIEKQLSPYIQRLQAKEKTIGLAVFFKKEMDNIHTSFEHDDYCSDKPLSGEFLLGFHCQRANWRGNTDIDENEENKNTEEE